eukprot:CAMPEP_0194421310 /NCGR_PEP_ID=MMETSP0176-20130528/20512_1 /TAXON_ID=216777 /ORGANISM="Proboscia alata, Strain PI-D3" /LENGTH=51 /DNA_ID=CAMNT_0039229315 /DNA_START=527 /DNA_END=679 /DNA_ORIENTATION=+
MDMNNENSIAARDKDSLDSLSVKDNSVLTNNDKDTNIKASQNYDGQICVDM